MAFADQEDAKEAEQGKVVFLPAITFSLVPIYPPEKSAEETVTPGPALRLVDEAPGQSLHYDPDINGKESDTSEPVIRPTDPDIDHRP